MITDTVFMGMVDRYKKAGGFVQLVQVIETCAPKKREQFMKIISEENPEWADALNQKCISFEKIINWKPEIILEVMATVNMLSFSAALKALSAEQLEGLFQKLSPQDRKKLETSMQENNHDPNQISASVMKVISETRSMLISGALKYDKVDPDLYIPDGFESKLGKNEQTRQTGESLSFDGPSLNFNVVNVANGGVPPAEVEKLQKKLILLSREIQNLRTENQVMKEKLEKIKKIA